MIWIKAQSPRISYSGKGSQWLLLWGNEHFRESKKSYFYRHFEGLEAEEITVHLSRVRTLGIKDGMNSYYYAQIDPGNKRRIRMRKLSCC